jgi:hypothetical protein
VRDHSYHRTFRRVSLCKPMSHHPARAITTGTQTRLFFPCPLLPVPEWRYLLLYTSLFESVNHLFSDPVKGKVISERTLYETDPSTWLGADAFTRVIQPLLKKGLPPAVVAALANLFRVAPNRPLLLDQPEYFAWSRGRSRANQSRPP